MRETPQQFANAWYDALAAAPKKDWTSLTEKFLAELHHSGRLNWLSEVVRVFEERERAERGAVAVTLRQAKDFDSSAIKTLLQELFPGQATDLEKVIDPEVIGGAQIETANERWDYSVRGQLNQLEKQLTQ